MVALSEVVVDLVAAQDENRFRALMQAHHYLGALPGIGETLRYVAHHRGQWLALVVFSAPALKCAARDRWIGWSFGVQFDRLHLLTNNSRFLLLPGAPVRPFERRYTGADIRLLAEVDAALGDMSGPATRAVMRREFEVFGQRRFERLARLSNGHLYNLRRSRTYQRKRTTFTKTRPTPVAIGERRKPRPDGQPGFLRVDTVHQGDLDGVKGVYHINTVDEVTQYEHIGCVQAISERFLLPVLEANLQAYPFPIQGFHTDNGSEYINQRVAALLNKLHIGEFTKSRARKSNDNALVEGKNAAVVRKHLGYDHIPQRFSARVNAFTHDVLSPFLNHHRPCLFPTEQRDHKGKINKRYRDQDIATPYEKLKSLPNAATFLKPGVTFQHLDAIAYAQSDLDAARAVNAARDELFRTIGYQSAHAAA